MFPGKIRCLLSKSKRQALVSTDLLKVSKNPDNFFGFPFDPVRDGF